MLDRIFTVASTWVKPHGGGKVISKIEPIEKVFTLYIFSRIVYNFPLFFFHGEIYILFTLLIWCFCRVQTGHDLCRDIMDWLNGPLIFYIAASKAFFFFGIDILRIVLFLLFFPLKDHSNVRVYISETIEIRYSLKVINKQYCLVTWQKYCPLYHIFTFSA